MKALPTLILGILIGSMGGFFLAQRAHKKPTQAIPSATNTRQITPRRIHQPENKEANDHSQAGKFTLSDWRATHHLLDMTELLEEISQLTDEDFPAVLARANGDDRINVLLHQQWAKLNPRRSLTYILNETDYNSLDCHEEDVPDIALLTGTALLQLEGKKALPLILKLMARVDKGSIGHNYGDKAGYQSLFKAWAIADFDSTLKFLMIDQEGYWYNGSEIGLADGAAQVGRSRDLMQWINDHPDTFLAYDFVKQAVAAWAEQDPAAALAWAQSGQAPRDESPLEGIAETWVKKDTEAFLAWAKSQGPTGLNLAYEQALHDPQKTTAWLLENDDGSPAWNKIRSALLAPLDRSKGPVISDLERYFKLITSGDPEVHRQNDHLGKLFLKYTQNPGNYDPNGERTFRLYEIGPVSTLVAKYDLQTEFDQFRDHQKELTIEANRLEKEINALSNARQELYHESGLEQNN